MTTLWERFRYTDRTHMHKVNALTWPFVFATLVYGIGFVALGWWSGVQTSSLYQAMYLLSPGVPALWGALAILAALLYLTLVISRTRGYGEMAAMLGFCVWFFAGLTYLLNGFWLVLFTVAAPNIYFWAYLYILVKDYQRGR